jgi:bifunctional enzyme CysN/CysC
MLPSTASPDAILREQNTRGKRRIESIPADPQYNGRRSTHSAIAGDRSKVHDVDREIVAVNSSENVVWQALEISREQRAKSKNQKPAVVWLTGLSGAGKSTIANLVEKKLASMRRHTFLLDGDNVRHGLNRDLGFTDADRIENIRRAGEVAKLMTDAGLIVIAAFISPFRAEREMLRKMMCPGEFFEIFVDTPLEQAEARDVKGLYKKARNGQLKNFTGIDSPYEAPVAPELRIDMSRTSPGQAADAIVALLS